MVAVQKLPVSTPIRAPMPNISVAWEFIDPVKAQQYLGRNFDRNRRISAGWLATLVDILSSGEFLPMHQGIAFDEEGFLIDGQHRLTAIVQAEVGAWLLVSRGVSREAVLAMDRHARRQDHDQVKIVAPDLDPTKSHVAIARMMYVGMSSAWARGGVRLLGQSLVEFMRRHDSAICFSMRYHGKGRTSGAPIRSVVARAFYHADHDRLDQFLRVLTTGESFGHSDFAACRLRKKIEQEPYLTKGGRDARLILYKLTVSALSAFLEHRPIIKLYEASSDPFPLPE